MPMDTLGDRESLTLGQLSPLARYVLKVMLKQPVDRQGIYMEDQIRIAADSLLEGGEDTIEQAIQELSEEFPGAAGFLKKNAIMAAMQVPLQAVTADGEVANALGTICFLPLVFCRDPSKEVAVPEKLTAEQAQAVLELLNTAVNIRRGVVFGVNESLLPPEIAKTTVAWQRKWAVSIMTGKEDTAVQAQLASWQVDVQDKSDTEALRLVPVIAYMDYEDECLLPDAIIEETFADPDLQAVWGKSVLEKLTEVTSEHHFLQGVMDAMLPYESFGLIESLEEEKIELAAKQTTRH